MPVSEDRRVSVFLKQGWCPVPWGHHPAEVRAELRRIGMRPQLKQCFMNCQRFAVFSRLDVAYHEGWVLSVIPIMHAWLSYRGSVLDLTLLPDRDVTYMQSMSYTRREILANVSRRQSWGPINERALHSIAPWGSAVDQMKLESALQEILNKWQTQNS